MEKEGGGGTTQVQISFRQCRGEKGGGNSPRKRTPFQPNFSLNEKRVTPLIAIGKENERASNSEGGERKFHTCFSS